MHSEDAIKEMLSSNESIHFIEGDATEPVVTEGLRILPHICNNQGGWGRGYVIALSRKWDKPEKRYRQLSESGLHLGDIQVVPIYKDLVVVNMIAQNGYKTPENPVPVNYLSLNCALNNLKKWINSWEDVQECILTPGYLENPPTIHMPRIGCGLGGGDWRTVELLIQCSLFSWDVFVYDLPQGKIDPGIEELAKVIEEK